MSGWSRDGSPTICCRSSIAKKPTWPSRAGRTPIASVARTAPGRRAPGWTPLGGKRLSPSGFSLPPPPPRRSLFEERVHPLEVVPPGIGVGLASAFVWQAEAAGQAVLDIGPFFGIGGAHAECLEDSQP